MADGMYDQRILRVFDEAYAIVANAKPKVLRFALQLLDVAFARLGEPMEGSQDTHCVHTVDTTDIGAGRGRPLDPLHTPLSAREVVGRQTKFSHHFGVGDSLARVLR